MQESCGPELFIQDSANSYAFRLDLTVMPLLTLGFFCLQLDRGNIANAITDDVMEDTKISQDYFNVGQQMLTLGIVLASGLLYSCSYSEQ